MAHTECLYRCVSFRIFADDDYEGSNTPLGDVNENITWPADTSFRLRFLLEEYNNGTYNDTVAFQFGARLNGGTWGDVLDATYLTTPATSYFAYGDDTTQQIGSGSYCSNNNSFIEQEDVTPGTTDSMAGNEVEIEICLALNSAQVNDGDVIDIEIYYHNGNNPLDDYTVDYATFTVGTYGGSTVEGILDKTLENATVASTVDLNTNAVTNVTLEDVNISSTSIQENIDATINVTLEDVTVASTVDVSTTSYTSTNVNLEDATIASTVDLNINAVTNVTLDDTTVTSTVTIPVTINSSTDLEDATIDSTVTIPVTINSSTDLEDATVASTVDLNTNVVTNVTLEDAIIVSSLAIATPATLSLTLEDATITSTIDLNTNAVTNVTLEDITAVSAVNLNTNEVTNVTLDDAIIASTVDLNTNAVTNVTLEDTLAASTVIIATPIITNVILEDISIASTVDLNTNAVTNVTLEDASTVSSTSISTTISLDVTLEDATITSAVDLNTNAVTNVTLDDATISSAASTVVPEITAQTNTTLEDATVASTVDLNTNAVTNTTLEDATAEATLVQENIDAVTNVTLEDATVASTVLIAAIDAQSNITLEDVTIISTLVQENIDVVTNVTLEDATLNSATVQENIDAQSNVTLEDVSISSAVLVAAQDIQSNVTLEDAWPVGTGYVGNYAWRTDDYNRYPAGLTLQEVGPWINETAGTLNTTANGQITPAGTGSFWRLATYNDESRTWADDQSAEATIVSGEIGVALRSNSGNFYYVMYNTDGYFYIGAGTGSNEYDPSEQQTFYSLSSGDRFKASVTGQDGDIVVNVYGNDGSGWTYITSWSPSSPTYQYNSGNPGLVAWGVSGDLIDNFNAYDIAYASTVSTLNDATVTSTVIIPVTAVTNVTLEDATVTSTVIIPATAVTNVTLEDATLNSTATQENITTVTNVTLENVTVDSAALVAAQDVQSNITLENVTLNSTATQENITTVTNVTLEDVTVDSIVTIPAIAVVDVALEDAAISSTAIQESITDIAAVTLEDAWPVGTGYVGNYAWRTDNFNRYPAGLTLEEIGPWINETAGTLSINSNGQVTTSGTGSNWHLATYNDESRTWGDDQTVEASVVSNEIGVALRSNSGNFYYVMYNTDGYFYIGAGTGSTGFDPSEQQTYISLNQGDRFKASVTGQDASIVISVYTDTGSGWEYLTSWSPSGPTYQYNSGNPGLVTWGIGGVIDNFDAYDIAIGLTTKTLEDVSISSAALVAAQDVQSNVTLEDADVNSTVFALVDTESNVTLEDATVTSTVIIPATAVTNVTLEDADVNSTVFALVDAESNVTIEDATVASTVDVSTTSITIESAITLEDADVNSTVFALVDAESNVTLEDVTVASTINAISSAEVSSALEDATVASTVDLNTNAVTNVTLEDATLNSAVTQEAIDAESNVTLDDANVSSVIGFGTVTTTGATLDDTVSNSNVHVYVNIESNTNLEDGTVDSTFDVTYVLHSNTTLEDATLDSTTVQENIDSIINVTLDDTLLLGKAKRPSLRPFDITKVKAEIVYGPSIKARIKKTEEIEAVTIPNTNYRSVLNPQGSIQVKTAYYTGNDIRFLLKNAENGDMLVYNAVTGKWEPTDTIDCGTY